MKVAIIHDWIVSYGGGESVVLKLHELYPDAPVYTSVYNKKIMGKYFKDIDVRTSFIQNLPFGISKYKYYLPLMPIAFEQFDLKQYDLIISSSSCCAKGVNVNANSTHICYCHTPMRYAWDMYNEYNKEKGLKKAIIASQMHKLRQWDVLSSNRVDYFIANSQYVANRIKKHYRRESTVIYPGVNDNYYKIPIIEKTEEFYLLVTRLVNYKKVEVIINAFNKIGLPLIIVGDGPEKKRLKQIANKNIIFKGFISDEQLKTLYQKCKAFVYMAEEDFGIVLAEAQAMGKPVIAYKKGGASEIIKDDITGFLVQEQNEESLIKEVKKMEQNYKDFNFYEIRNNAQKFSEKEFINNIKEYIDTKMNK